MKGFYYKYWRMQSAEIKLIALFLLSALFMLVFLCSSYPISSIPCLTLVVAFSLAANHIPARLFVKRLNPYFIDIQYPFSRWNNIYQKPVKCSLRKSDFFKISCVDFYRQLSQQIIDMFSFINTETGFCRTITHETIINRIKQYEKSGKLQIITIKPVYKKNLVKIQDALLYNRCRGCPRKSNCRYRALSKKKRQFYYIEFYIPERNDGQNGN